jgi:hypothetical protein
MYRLLRAIGVIRNRAAYDRGEGRDSRADEQLAEHGELGRR